MHHVSRSHAVSTSKRPDRRRRRRSGLGGGVASVGLAAGLVAAAYAPAAAYAGPPWTVSVGGSSTGAPVSYTASTVGASPQINFATPAANLDCVSATAVGTVTPGTSGVLGTIGDVQLQSCSGPLGATLNNTSTAGSHDIVITGDTVNGITPVLVTGIAQTFSDDSGLCSFDGSGSVPGSFDAATQLFTISGGGLTLTNVLGCFGVINEGDPATMAATYRLSGPGTITVTN